MIDLLKTLHALQGNGEAFARLWSAPRMNRSASAAEAFDHIAAHAGVATGGQAATPGLRRPSMESPE
mgnify:CR=1 FL=1